MQVRKWLISGEINYNVCRICSLTLLPPGSTHPDSDHAECSSRMNPPIKCFIFSKQILHTGKAYTASRKKRAPRVIRLLSRVLSSRTSRTYQPRAEALAQSWRRGVFDCSCLVSTLIGAVLLY